MTREKANAAAGTTTAAAVLSANTITEAPGTATQTTARKIAALRFAAEALEVASGNERRSRGSSTGCDACLWAMTTA